MVPVYLGINRHHKVPTWYRAFPPPSDILLPTDWFNSPTAIPVGAVGTFGCMIVQFSTIKIGFKRRHLLLPLNRT